MYILLDVKNKPTEECLIFSKFMMAAFGQRSKTTNFDPINHISARYFNPIHPIWTEIGMDIELDTRNMHADEFSFFLKIEDGRRGQKLNLD